MKQFISTTIIAIIGLTAYLLTRSFLLGVALAGITDLILFACGVKVNPTGSLLLYSICALFECLLVGVVIGLLKIPTEIAYAIYIINVSYGYYLFGKPTQWITNSIRENDDRSLKL